MLVVCLGAEVSGSLAAELRDVKDRLKRIEENMVTKDDLEALIETLEVLSENPRVLEEIDEAIKGYKRGEYHRYEDIFGEK